MRNLLTVLLVAVTAIAAASAAEDKGEFYVLYKRVNGPDGKSVMEYYSHIIECDGDYPSSNGLDKLAMKFFDGIEPKPRKGITLTSKPKNPKVEYGGYAYLTAESIATQVRLVLWSGPYKIVGGAKGVFKSRDPLRELDLIKEIRKAEAALEMNPLKNMPTK